MNLFFIKNGEELATNFCGPGNFMGTVYLNTVYNLFSPFIGLI